MALHHDPHWPRAASWFSTQPQGEIDVALIGAGAHLSAITPNNAHTTPAAIRDALLRYSTWNQTCQIDFADFGAACVPRVVHARVANGS